MLKIERIKSSKEHVIEVEILCNLNVFAVTLGQLNSILNKSNNIFK